MSTDEVRLNDAFHQPNVDTDSLPSSSSGNNDSVDSCVDLPALEQPPPDSSYSSDDLSYDSSSSTNTTLDATLPDGVIFDPIDVVEVDDTCKDGDGDLDTTALDATNLQPGEVLDTTVPVPEVISVPGPDLQSTRHTRSGRRVTTPLRYRDTTLMTVDGTPRFSIFDVDDEIDEDFLDFHDLGLDTDVHSGSLFSFASTSSPARGL